MSQSGDLDPEAVGCIGRHLDALFTKRDKDLICEECHFGGFKRHADGADACRRV